MACGCKGGNKGGRQMSRPASRSIQPATPVSQQTPNARQIARNSATLTQPKNATSPSGMYRRG